MGAVRIIARETRSGVVRATDALAFEAATLALIQKPVAPADGSSPYAEDFVEVTRGKMYVTGIYRQGFYVSDVSASCATGYNHMLVYTYRNPDGVEADQFFDVFPGYRIRTLAGNVTEFLGMTEFSFPIVEIEKPRDAAELRVPFCPAVLSSEELDDAAQMEKNEAGLVEIVDGVVPNFDPDGSDRVARDYRRYGQWPLALNLKDAECKKDSAKCPDACRRTVGGQVKCCCDAGCSTNTRDKACVSIVTQTNAAEIDVDVLKKLLGKKIARLRGNLLHVVPVAGIDIWIIEPRNVCDVEADAVDRSGCVAPTSECRPTCGVPE